MRRHLPETRLSSLAEDSVVEVHAEESISNKAAGSAEYRGRLGGRIAGTLATTVAIHALSLISGALLARLLGVQNRGLLAAVILLPTVVAHVGDLGGPIANAFVAATRPNRISTLIANSFFLTIVQTIVLGAIAAVAMTIFLHRYEGLTGAGWLFLLVYLPANLAYRYLNYISLGRGEFRQYNLGRLALQGSYVFGVALLFLFNRRDLRWALAAYAVCHIVACAVAARGLLKFISLRIRGSWALLRTTLSYGLRAHLGNLTPVEMMQLDLAVVIALLGPHNAGLYAVAASTGMIVRGYGGALGTVALAHVASAESYEQRRWGAGTVFRLSLILVIGTAAVLFAGSGVLVPLFFGSQFSGAIPIVRVLLLGMVAAALRQVLGDCLRGAGKPLTGTISEVSGWLIAIAGLAVFVPLFGTVGAAVAVSLSYGATLLISVLFARRIGLSLRQLFVPTKADAALAASIVRNGR